MVEDSYDYKVLLNAILRQAIDDYIKLQHPKFRKKKYLQEAFDSAVDMFFDSEFKFLHVKDPEGNFLSLKDLISSILEDDRLQMDKMKNHVVNEARSFWETKMVNTLYIPDSFIYDGHVYAVHHSEEEDVSIEEKPKCPKSNYAIPGFYFFDNHVIEYAKNIQPSDRGELEITDVIKQYCQDKLLNVIKMDKGTAWLDTGTVGSLMEASQFVHVLENRQGLKVGCVEEQAYLMNYINDKQLKKLSTDFNNGYGEYLKTLLNA